MMNQYVSPMLIGDEGRMRVLIVDDDDLMLDSCAAALSAHGHEIRATDGVGALKVLAAEPWDAVVIDILMPNVDGIEVIGAAKRLAQPPLILAMSGGGRVSADECLSLATGLGADAAFTKPIDYAALVRAIEASIP